MDVMTR